MVEAMMKKATNLTAVKH